MSKVFVFREFGGPEAQALVDRAVPAPGPGEVRVAVRAAGVNPADVKRREGRFGRKIQLPAPMGLELAGVVEDVGEGVTGFGPGDAVLGQPARGWGAFAEHTLARADRLARKPALLSFAEASVLPVAGAAAWDAVRQVPLRAGRTVLVNGAGGGVGVVATQLCTTVPGLRVVGTASEGKRALVEQLGAAFVPTGEGLLDRLREAAPAGLDAVIDLVGGAALRLLAPMLNDPAAVVSTADPDTAVGLGGAGVARRPTAEVLPELLAAVERGVLRPRVGRVLPLERAAGAVAVVEAGHAAGKVVVRVAAR
ncbi:NADP-dependent oxidoreductase [Georgenia sp. AZ-5]|uniref:NADP-dependent oxidoreductase n=1 Tax=Georgenia sp. AZ-5 TaxID=3367526 RepID=UPI0037550C18